MVQKYLQSRDGGASRSSSAETSGFADYCGPDFLRSLEKRFAAAVIRWKALYPEGEKELCHGYRWMLSAVSGQKNALFIMNERAIKLRGQSFLAGMYGPVCAMKVREYWFHIKTPLSGWRDPA